SHLTDHSLPTRRSSDLTFGRTLETQLSQASFENLLAVTLLKKQAPRWVLEDEGRMIGANHLPECLRERMAQASIAVIEDPFERRDRKSTRLNSSHVKIS